MAMVKCSMPEMIVAAKPYSRLVRPFYAHTARLNLKFYPMGRDALVAGLRYAKVPAGGRVLFPAFYCEGTIRAVKAAGYGAEFLDIGSGLLWSERAVIEAISKRAVSAIVITDYFGWRPRNLESLISLCRGHELIVVRDCCHSPLSWRAEDPSADVTIFSYRKLLPIADGGALMVNRTDLVEGESLAGRGVKRQGVVREVAYACERFVFQQQIVNPYPMMDRLRKLGTEASPATVAGRATSGELVPSAELVDWLNNESELLRIGDRRRENASGLGNMIREIPGPELAMPEPRGSDSPQVLPVRVPNATKLVTALRRRGIGATTWPGPELPVEVGRRTDLYPEANRLAGQIACLPVHQDVSLRQTEYIARTIRMLASQNG